MKLKLMYIRYSDNKKYIPRIILELIWNYLQFFLINLILNEFELILNENKFYGVF